MNNHTPDIEGLAPRKDPRSTFIGGMFIGTILGLLIGATAMGCLIIRTWGDDPVTACVVPWRNDAQAYNQYPIEAPAGESVLTL